MWTPTLLSLSLSSHPFTRYQEQGLLVVNFGLLRSISTILTIPTISLSPPKLLHNLSWCSLPPHKHLTNSLEIVNSLLQHLNSKSHWWLHHQDYPPWPPEGSRCWIPCVGRKVFQHNIIKIDCRKVSGTWYFSRFFFLIFYDFSLVLPPPHSFLSVSLFKERTRRVLLISWRSRAQHTTTTDNPFQALSKRPSLWVVLQVHLPLIVPRDLPQQNVSLFTR